MCSVLSPTPSPYSEPVEPLPATRWDLESELRGFTLRLLLHGTGPAEVKTLHFHQLLARPGTLPPPSPHLCVELSCSQRPPGLEEEEEKEELCVC